jgi:Cu(I)/Ag(I) efflux system membrane fusion protein
MVQNLGIRTAPVTRGTFARRVDATGAIGIDEHAVVVVEARAPGWVERLAVRAVGDPVTRGQVVAEIYAPELRAAAEELALAEALDDPALAEAARTRLDLLGAPAGASGRRMPVVAPLTGVITELTIREGSQVGPGMPLAKIADLATVWLIAEVPEALGAWVAVGQRAEARVTGLPGRAFEGTVDYVYPLLDARARTLRVRLVIDNSHGTLRPGMYANVAIVGEVAHDVTLVPAEAVIRTGTRTVVMIAEARGRYRPVEVEIGAERDGEAVVLGGLATGDEVVVSGQFLIDSEASLAGAYRRLADEPPASRTRLMGKDVGPGTYQPDARDAK